MLSFGSCDSDFDLAPSAQRCDGKGNGFRRHLK